MSAAKRNTDKTQALEAIKRHPVYAALALIGISVVGLAAFLGGLTSIKEWFSPPPPVEVVTVQSYGRAKKPPRFLVSILNRTDNDIVLTGVKWKFRKRDQLWIFIMEGAIVEGRPATFLTMEKSDPYAKLSKPPAAWKGRIPCGGSSQTFAPPIVLPARKASSVPIANLGLRLPGLFCTYDVTFDTSAGPTKPAEIVAVHHPAPIHLHKRSGGHEKLLRPDDRPIDMAGLPGGPLTDDNQGDVPGMEDDLIHGQTVVLEELNWQINSSAAR